MSSAAVDLLRLTGGLVRDHQLAVGGGAMVVVALYILLRRRGRLSGRRRPGGRAARQALEAARGERAEDPVADSVHAREAAIRLRRTRRRRQRLQVVFAGCSVVVLLVLTIRALLVRLLS